VLSAESGLCGVEQAEKTADGAAPMEVADPSTSGGAPESAPPAVNGAAEAEAATPSTEGTAKKVKKEKKVAESS